MRPSRRLLLIGMIGLGVSALVVSFGAVAADIAIALWVGLFGAMLIDILLTPGGRAADVSLTGPPEVFSGETARFDAVFRGDVRLLPDTLQARLELDEALGPTLAFTLRTGEGGATGMANVMARRRGHFRVLALWLSWPSRLGLWDMTGRFALDTMLKVIPNIRPVLSGQIDAKVRSDLYGVKENALVGEGSEFHQLRDFMPGMDTRAIDWKRSARRRNLVAKEMQSERNHQIILALDNGYLMREEIAGLPKIDHAVNAALAVAWAAGLGGDLVGLFSFDAEPRLFVPPQPGRAAFPALRSHTAALAYQSVASNHTLAMAHLNGRLRRRSLIVIFSDFVDKTTAELMVENIQVLSRAHVIVFVVLRDPVLEARIACPATSLQGMAEAVAAEEMARERQLVLDGLRRIGVICLDTAPDRLTPALVSTYLTIKARELI